MSKSGKIQLKVISSIALITGFLTFGMVFFGRPGLIYVLKTFRFAPQGAFRQLGVGVIVLLAAVVLMLVSIRWLRLVTSRTNGFLFILIPCEKDPSSSKTQLLILVSAVTGLSALQITISGQVENFLDQLFLHLITPVLLWFFVLSMLMILNFSNRSNLYGHQLGAIKRAYLPYDDDPFELI